MIPSSSRITLRILDNSFTQVHLLILPSDWITCSSGSLIAESIHSSRIIDRSGLFLVNSKYCAVFIRNSKLAQTHPINNLKCNPIKIHPLCHCQHGNPLHPVSKLNWAQSTPTRPPCHCEKGTKWPTRQSIVPRGTRTTCRSQWIATGFQPSRWQGMRNWSQRFDLQHPLSLRERNEVTDAAIHWKQWACSNNGFVFPILSESLNYALSKARVFFVRKYKRDKVLTSSLNWPTGKKLINFFYYIKFDYAKGFGCILVVSFTILRA